MGMPARGKAAFSIAIRLASASIIRCRSADLVGVRSNFRLPPVPSMRRAPAMPLFRTQSAAEKTSLAPHDSKARLLSDHDSQGFMAKPCTPHPHCAARAALQAANPHWRGPGAGPLAFSWGSKGDILSRERISPLSAAPHGVGKSRSLFALLPLRAMRGKREDFSFEKPSLFTYFLLCRSNYSASCIAFAAATAFACASAEHCS